LIPSYIPDSTVFFNCKCLLIAYSLFLALRHSAIQVYGYISRRMKSSLFMRPTSPVSEMHLTVVLYSPQSAIKSSSPIILPFSKRNSYKRSQYLIITYIYLRLLDSFDAFEFIGAADLVGSHGISEYLLGLLPCILVVHHDARHFILALLD
jgi:hypothetical protein